MSRHALARRNRPARAAFTRVRAILAAGLALGVGTTLTLASWNDAEVAGADIGATTFNIEGSTDNTVWDQHPDSGSAAVLDFGVSPLRLSPGNTRYALFAVRTTSSTTVGGMLTVAAPSFTVTNDFTAALQTDVRTVPSPTCTQSAFDGGTAVPSGGTPVVAAAGQPVYFCFRVGLPATGVPNSAQGESSLIAWEITGVSD